MLLVGGEDGGYTLSGELLVPWNGGWKVSRRSSVGTSQVEAGRVATSVVVIQVGPAGA